MPTVFLSAEECAQLRVMLRRGEGKARVLNRARILLKLHERIAEKLIANDCLVSKKTVTRIRNRYEAGGLVRALQDLPRPGQPPKITDKIEAHLVAVACSAPPNGRARWTLELLANRLVRDKKVKCISSVAVLKRLRKRGIKPWREKNVVRSESHSGIHHAHGRPA